MHLNALKTCKFQQRFYNNKQLTRIKSAVAFTDPISHHNQLRVGYIVTDKSNFYFTFLIFMRDYN